MKIIKTILIISLLSFIPLNAKNNKAITGGVAAGIAILSLISMNSKPECKVLNYKNYIVNKKMFTFPAEAIIDNKFNACVSKIVIFNGNIKNTDSYKIIISNGEIVNARKQENGYKILIAKTIVSAMEQVSKGRKEKKLYISIDMNGVVKQAEEPLGYLINKKLFTVKDKIIIQKDTFSQEIIYTGISNNELHLQYREYIGNGIKWPFNINLIFDMEKSKIIKVKDYTIEIIEVNNSYIVYKVL